MDCKQSACCCHWHPSRLCGQHAQHLPKTDGQGPNQWPSHSGETQPSNQEGEDSEWAAFITFKGGRKA